jgi:mitogen-activated protein kinase kinase kinase
MMIPTLMGAHIMAIRYLGTSQTERYLFIILEYVPGGSIASMLGQFGPFTEDLIRYTAFVSRALYHL